MKYLLISLVVAAVLPFQGCGTIAKFTHAGDTVITQAESSDQLILRAEQAAQTAKETFNVLVHLERDNEAALKQVNPEIHKFTNVIRQNGINWIQQLRTATKNFKANRTAANQASVNTYLATVMQAVKDANNYIAQAKPVATTSP